MSDLGADNYGLDGYFGSDRFKYYRKNSLGHSTLSFNHSVQVAQDCGGQSLPGPQPPAPSETFITSFGSASGTAFPAPPGHGLLTCVPRVGEEQACTTVDLSAAYQGQGVTAVVRRVALRLDGAVRVTDSWVAARDGVPVAAALQTYADVAVAADGASALLSRGGRTMRVSLAAGSACAGATMTASPVRLHSPFYTTYNLTRIDVGGVTSSSCTGLDVILKGAE